MSKQICTAEWKTIDISVNGPQELEGDLLTHPPWPKGIDRREKEHKGLLFSNLTRGWVHTREGISWEPKCHFSGVTFGNESKLYVVSGTWALSKALPWCKSQVTFFNTARCFHISCIMTKMHKCWFYCALMKHEICWGWQLIPDGHGVRCGQPRNFVVVLFSKCFQIKSWGSLFRNPEAWWSFST